MTRDPHQAIFTHNARKPNRDKSSKYRRDKPLCACGRRVGGKWFYDQVTGAAVCSFCAWAWVESRPPEVIDSLSTEPVKSG